MALNEGSKQVIWIKIRKVCTRINEYCVSLKKIGKQGKFLALFNIFPVSEHALFKSMHPSLKTITKYSCFSFYQSFSGSRNQLFSYFKHFSNSRGVKFGLPEHAMKWIVFHAEWTRILPWRRAQDTTHLNFFTFQFSPADRIND